MESSALVYIILTIGTIALAMQMSPCLSVQGNCVLSPKEQLRNRVCLFAIYALLAGVSACRIAVGNDYWVYRFNFRLIAQQRHVASESGFNTIVYYMQKLFGYDNYLPIFALFSLLTVLFFVLALYGQSKDFAFSLFLLMTGGYYFNSLNSVRFYLALAIALFAMKHVLSHNYLQFLFWVIVGTVFHKSILLILPAYCFAAFLAWLFDNENPHTKRKNLQICVLVISVLLVLSLIFAKDFYRLLIFKFYPFYEGSSFDNGHLSYVNLLKCSAVLVFSAICYKSGLRNSFENRFYFALNLFALIVYLCGNFIPETSRIGYYLIISQVFLLPNLLCGLKANENTNRTFYLVCKWGILISFALYFSFLLNGMYATDIRLLPYRNWIFD